MMKRGPTREYKWQKRWCVLDAETLAYYTDELLKVCKGEIPLKKATCARRFTDNTAPFDAPSYGRERPFGFLLDIEPSAGKRRRAFYFDALEAPALEKWEAAIAKGAAIAGQSGQLCREVRRRCYTANVKRSFAPASKQELLKRLQHLSQDYADEMVVQAILRDILGEKAKPQTLKAWSALVATDGGLNGLNCLLQKPSEAQKSLLNQLQELSKSVDDTDSIRCVIYGKVDKASPVTLRAWSALLVCDDGLPEILNEFYKLPEARVVMDCGFLASLANCNGASGVNGTYSSSLTQEEVNRMCKICKCDKIQNIGSAAEKLAEELGGFEPVLTKLQTELGEVTWAKVLKEWEKHKDDPPPQEPPVPEAPDRQEAVRLTGFLRKSLYSCAGVKQVQQEKPAVVQRQVSTLLRKSLYTRATGLGEIKVSSLAGQGITEGDEEDDG